MKPAFLHPMPPRHPSLPSPFPRPHLHPLTFPPSPPHATTLCSPIRNYLILKGDF